MESYPWISACEVEALKSFHKCRHAAVKKEWERSLTESREALHNRSWFILVEKFFQHLCIKTSRRGMIKIWLVYYSRHHRLKTLVQKVPNAHCSWPINCWITTQGSRANCKCTSRRMPRFDFLYTSFGLFLAQSVSISLLERRLIRSHVFLRESSNDIKNIGSGVTTLARTCNKASGSSNRQQTDRDEDFHAGWQRWFGEATQTAY